MGTWWNVPSAWRGILAIPILALAFGPRPARAGTETATVEAVLAATVRGDHERVQELASRDDPDPWLVVDALVARDELQCAHTFAEGTPSPVRPALVAWSDGAFEPPSASATRRALEEIEDLLRRAAPQQALRRIEALSRTGASVVDVRLEFLRGRALDALGEHAAAAHAYTDALAEAEDLGWWTFASEACYRAVLAHDARVDLRAMVPLCERRLVIEQRLTSRVGIGRAHFGLATVLFQLGRLEEAREHRLRAREYAEAAGDGEYLAKCLSDLAAEFAWQDDAEGAYLVGQEAVAALEHVDPMRIPSRFRSSPTRLARLATGIHQNAASMAARLGKMEDARRHGQAAIEKARESGEARSVARVSGFLAVVDATLHQRAGDGIAARTELEKALALYEEGGDRLDRADTLRRLARVASSLGDFPEALRQAEEAVEVLRDVGNPRALARGLLQAGNAAVRLGHLDDAEVWLGQVVGLARRLDDPDLEAEALLELAGAQDARGRVGSALKLLERAKSLPLRDDVESLLGTLLYRESGFRDRLGDHAGAKALLAQAADHLIAAGDENTLMLVRRWQAEVLAGEGRYDESRSILEAQLARVEERGWQPGIADTRTGLANLAFRERDYERARGLRTEVLRLYEEMGDEKMALAARSQLGRELFWTGRAEEGRELLLASRRRASDSGHLMAQAWTAVGLAEIETHDGDYAAGLAWAEQGLDDLEAFGLDLADNETAYVREDWAPLHRLGMQCAWDLDDARSLLRFLEWGRASALVAALDGRDAVRSAHVPSRLRHAEQEARAAASVARHRLLRAERGGRRSAIQAAKADLDAAQERLRRSVTHVRREVRHQADLSYAASPTLEEMSAALHPGEGLVLYAEVAERAMALVLHAGVLDPVDLGPSGEIEAMLAAWRSAEGEFDDAKTGDVRQRLIDGLGLPDTVTRLLISPGEGLAQVPFGLLVPDRPLALVPSATVLCTLRRQHFEPGKQVLALGNPEYEMSGPRLATAPPRRGGMRLVPLPATALEARTVGDVVLLGPDASESGLEAALPGRERWRAVHFACHGLLDPEQPGNSALALSLDAENDGLLEAREVFGLSVPADLVVLSGCETGRGRVVKGEGLLGLARAFMSAGAPRVLCSLWKVDDEATRALMVRFYELWNPGPPPSSPGATGASSRGGLLAADALQQAQAFVRSQEQWAQPRYWAAWVLWGLPE